MSITMDITMDNIHNYPVMPKKTCNRKTNTLYWNEKKQRIDTWSGKNITCCHFKQRAMCKDGCGGAFICIHGRRRNTCRECGCGTEICTHNKHKSSCRICSPHLFCSHNRQKYNCWECYPEKFCIHHNRLNKCKKCNEKIANNK